MQDWTRKVCFTIDCWIFDPSDREVLEVWFDLDEESRVSHKEVCKRLGCEFAFLRCQGVPWPLTEYGDSSWPLQPGHRYHLLPGGTGGTPPFPCVRLAHIVHAFPCESGEPPVDNS